MQFYYIRTENHDADGWTCRQMDAFNALP